MPTLLAIDDSEQHRQEIRRAAIESGLFDQILEAEDGLQGLKMLMSCRPDLVICDLEMPGLDGGKLLRAARARSDEGNVPFLFLTASADVARRARLLDEGAADAIQKPFHRVELVARLQLHMKIKRLQDELMQKNAALVRLSSTDGLTGLRTRRYIHELLNVEFLKSQRYGSPLAILMADLDHFKLVNDEHGHPAGDAVLRGVAADLLGLVRATDCAGRYGGEEILVVMPQNDLRGAGVLAERWRERVASQRYRAEDGPEIRVTLSVGIAEFLPELASPEALVTRADKALYRAKAAGRNRVERAAG